MVDEGGNDLTSSVISEQLTVEGVVGHGSPKQRLTNLKVVSVEEVKHNMDIRREQTAVVAEGRRSAVRGDNGIVLSHFLEQSTNVLDDS